MILIRQIARKTYRAAHKANTRVENNEGYKYPHRVNYPRHHHLFFAANIRYDFPPRFNFSHASTPSIHPPLSHRCFFHPVSTVPTLLVSRCPPCISTRTLRLRLFQPIGELVIPRVLARTTETRRFGRGPTYATTSSWPSPSPPSHSSLSGPPRHVSIARSLPITVNPSRRECRVRTQSGWWTRHPARATMKVLRARSAPTR